MIELLFENLKEKPNFFEENLKKFIFKNDVIKYKGGSCNKLFNKNTNDMDILKNKKLSVDVHLSHKNLNPLFSSKNVNKSKNIKNIT